MADGQRGLGGIAIVGMSARFPGCGSAREYWAKLMAGESLLSSATDAELLEAGVDPAGARNFVRSGTLLEEAESFDAKFFDFSRREAEMTDPQQRIFLEIAYEALEDAGIAADGAVRTGVFAGIGMNTYILEILANPELVAAAGGYQLMLGNDKDFLATRAAYKLNLRGPAVAVQTACSTSLAAVHLACQSLLAGECDAALAGGVSVVFPQVAGYEYVPGMILSPDGVCRPFDERAHGTVPGRGAGLVVLKRESDAVAAGDTVYAVIAGSAWNNDGGGKVGYTAPSVEGQAEVIRAAQAAAGITPDRIGYVEAHGTGTELGDPIEVAALAEVFGKRRPGAAGCVLGSVKANMGHADVAAGVAGLIKAALAVHHGVIPGTVGFERANPALGLERTPFRVSATAVEWKTVERWAGVSSFGIGGTNVHLCLRPAAGVEAGVEAETELEAGPWVFPLSAKTEGALGAGVARLGEFAALQGDFSPGAAAATLQTGRRKFAVRRAVVAETRAELAEALGKAGKSHAGSASRVAFLFPGQGQQFGGMAAELYARDGAFQELVHRGLVCLPGWLAAALLAVLCGKETGREAGHEFGPAAMPTSLAQPLLFLVEYALAMRWMDLGVQPAALLGHSLGELTAAAVARVFSFEDGLRLAAERGRLMQSTPVGAMLAVSLPVDAIGVFLTPDVWIAAENGPRLTVVSGSVAAIEQSEARLRTARVASVRLQTDRAFHTPGMAEVAGRFREAVEKVDRKTPTLPWLSNVTGTWITADEATSAQYWADQMTARVRFRENAAVLAGLGAGAGSKAGHFLLEVGPGDALGNLVRQQDRGALAASSLGVGPLSGKTAVGDFRSFQEAAARLWENGTELRWERMAGYPKQSRRRISLPTYAFERERFYVEKTAGAGKGPTSAGGGSASDKLAGTALEKVERRSDVATWFYAPTWQRTPAAASVLGRRREPVRTWILMGSAGESIWEEHLAAGLSSGGAHVLRISSLGGSREDFEAFWKEHREVVQVHGGSSVGLLCCWTSGADELGQGVELFAELAMFLQSAQRARVQFAQVEWVIDGFADVPSSGTGEPMLESTRAVAEGLARVVAVEFPGVGTRVIDCGVLGGNAGAGWPSLKDRVDRIVAEVGTISAVGSTVAYRQGRAGLTKAGLERWNQVWMPLRFAAPESSRFRMGGTYVITGGMGGIGYTLARHLLDKFLANVVLIGRTALPPRGRWEEWLTERGSADATSRRIVRAKSLEEVARQGGELLLLAADVADGEAMEAAWKRIEERFGQVNGVIHAAGLAGSARISALDRDLMNSVMRPKVAGSRVLAEILAKRNAAGVGQQLDFLLFCSSISAVLPGVGEAAYAAANAFQDRYATWCRQHLDLPALSVNFAAWQEVGMAADIVAAGGPEELLARRIHLGILPDEGVECFERALAAGEVQVLISPVDVEALLRGVLPDSVAGGRLAETVSVEKSSRAGEDARVSLGSEASEETAAVIGIWRELLGADEVEPTDNFFAVGGHSLLGTMVLARVRDRFGVELGIRAIFDAPTPEGLGMRIREARLAQPAEEPVAAGGDREEFEF